MNILGIELTCEQYTKVFDFVAANYSEKDWNVLPNEEKKKEIKRAVKA